MTKADAAWAVKLFEDLAQERNDLRWTLELIRRKCKLTGMRSKKKLDEIHLLAVNALAKEPVHRE